MSCIATFSSTPIDTPTQTPAVNPTPTPNATATPTPLPTNGTGQIPFFVESNSTVTQLFFNSTSAELSFTVSGESGTWGYVEITIAKSLVSNIQDVKVYLDGNQLNTAITDNGDTWLLHFTYTHSTHRVIMTLSSAPSGESPLGPALVVGLPITAVALFFVITRLRAKKTKTGTNNSQKTLRFAQ